MKGKKDNQQDHKEYDVENPAHRSRVLNEPSVLNNAERSVAITTQAQNKTTQAKFCGLVPMWSILLLILFIIIIGINCGLVVVVSQVNKDHFREMYPNCEIENNITQVHN